MIKVLIVEDEPPIARAVKQLICRYSDAFQVVGTEINGRAALERLGRGEVDVVFTDIRMPVMDGLELLENIQRDYPEVVNGMNSNCATWLTSVSSSGKASSYAALPTKLRPAIPRPFSLTAS